MVEVLDYGDLTILRVLPIVVARGLWCWCGAPGQLRALRILLNTTLLVTLSIMNDVAMWAIVVFLVAIVARSECFFLGFFA